MNFFPVFARELRSALFNWRLRKKRLGIGLWTVMGLAVLMIVERAGGLSLARLMPAIPIAEIGPFVLFVFGLQLGGNLLAVERQEGTLPLLLLTRLTGYDIILGKLFQAVLLGVHSFLAAIPALMMPLIDTGAQWGELWLMALGSLNVLFFAGALGLLGSVLCAGRNATGLCLALFSPLLIVSTPLGRLLPSGPVRDGLSALQWLNPCDALLHAQMAAARFRPGAYWSALLSSHAVAWALVALAGLLLPRASRWQSGANAGVRSKKWWWVWSARANQRPLAWRRRLLNRNSFHWLTSRERLPTVNLWIYLAITGGGLGWLTWVARGVGVTFVLVIALSAFCHITLLAMVSSEAGRRLVEDRLSGALEMVLCTPLSVPEIVRGQWLSLRRRYLPAVVVIMLMDAVSMTAGYVTFGFGGMLEPQDRGPWLFAWSAGILLLPVWLMTLGWVAMRRALFASNQGEAGGIALIYLVIYTFLAFWGTSELGLLGGRGPEWKWWAAIFPLAVYTALLVAISGRARRILLGGLRHAAASRYMSVSESDSRPQIRVRWPWKFWRRSSPTAS